MKLTTHSQTIINHKMNGNLVVHLTSVHSAFDIRIFHKECKALLQAGYSVKLVAPNDQDKEVEVDGIKISGIINRVGRLKRMTVCVWQLYRRALAQNAKIYHFHDPELIPIGLLLKIHGKKVIHDIHEDLPRQILSKPWIKPWLRRPVAGLARAVEAVGAKIFDGLVTATPSIAERFPKNKTVTVQNYPIIGELISDHNYSYNQRPYLVSYIGGITEIRGIREMVSALSYLPTSPEIRVNIVGSFSSSSLEREIKEMKESERINFYGWKSRLEVAKILGMSRVGLVLFHPVPNHIYSQPNKLFEYMSAGIPVIASDFPHWRKIIQIEGCGLLVDPLNPKAIAEAIQWILEYPQEAEEMGKRGQQAVLARYNWEVEAEKLRTFYRERII